MTKQEIAKILSTVKIAYPHSFRGMSREDANATMALWERQFRDFDYAIVQMAIDSIIAVDTSDYMPSIGKVKDMILKLSRPDARSASEAWRIVKKTLTEKSLIWIDDSIDAFNELPPDVQLCIGSAQQLHQWARTSDTDIDTVIASNFMRAYREQAQRERERMLLPGDVKQALGIEDTKTIETKGENTDEH